MASADRIIEVFHEAKALSAGPERDAFLEEACKDDPQTKEQVLSLLRAHESAGDFMGVRPAITPDIEAELLRLKPEEAGERIGPYRLREQIGEGGFGVVWVAEQGAPMRRTVALKIIKLGMDTKEVVARFEQERQALAMMDHPNIAKVFDAGATEHGRPYFVMELVRGIKITDYCDQANLPTAERLELFIQVCHAVQHAHQKGIIHRDLKPSNVLVTLRDGVPVPKVIDFGVAKATEGRLGELSIYTRFEQMIGTPLYMSPEQAEMSGLDIDTRADIYALGVLLYELLTGRTPFDAAALTKAGHDEMRRIIREEEPPKPSTALDAMAQATLTTVAQHRASEPPKLIHSIRGDLDWIAMKTLEKDRDRRYETANGLAADIRRHLENEPVTARPPSRAYQFRKLVRRNKLAFAAGTAIAAALTAGFAATTWMYLRESDARKQASAERDAKELARQEAEAISTFMSEVFQSPDPRRDGRTITVAETLDRAAKKLETELADNPAQRARLEATLGNTYNALGLYRQSVPLLEKALEYRRAASSPKHPDTLRAIQDLAHSYHYVGRWDEAVKLREETLPLYREILGAEHPETITAMGALAYSYYSIGLQREAPNLRDAALKMREEVLALRRKVLGPEHLDTLRAMHLLADCYYEIGRRDEALKLREDAQALCRKAFGPEHPDTLRFTHHLAEFYDESVRKDEALNLREEAFVLRRKVLGPSHPDTLSTMARLAVSYAGVGRKDDLLKLCEEALPHSRQAFGPESPETVNWKQALATSYAGVGRKDEALKLLEEVLTLRSKALAPEHPNRPGAMLNLAEFYLRAGRLVEATPLLEAVSVQKPAGMFPVLRAATLQMWFAREADYAFTRQRVLKWATDDMKPEDAERVARISCLRPIDDAPTQQATLALARRALELGKEKRAFLPYAHLVLGMAEYRAGHFSAADEALLTAAKSASAAGIYYLQFTASFYRAMSLFRQGREAEAREFFATAEVKMKPFPADEKNLSSSGESNIDDLVLWLAFKEARALLKVRGKWNGEF